MSNLSDMVVREALITRSLFAVVFGVLARADIQSLADTVSQLESIAASAGTPPAVPKELLAFAQGLATGQLPPIAIN